MNARILAANRLHNTLHHTDSILGGAKHLDQRINMDTARSNVVFLRLIHDMMEDSESVIRRLGNSCIITAKCDNFPFRIGNRREENVNLVAFSGNGIDDSGLLAVREYLLQDSGARTVNRNRNIRNFLNAVDHPFQCLYLLRFRNGRAAVNIIRSRIRLNQRTALDFICVTILDRFRDCRNRSVDLLSDNYHCNTLLNILSNHRVFLSARTRR